MKKLKQKQNHKRRSGSIYSNPQDWSFYTDFFNKMGFEFSIQRRTQGKNKSSIIRLCKRNQIANLIDWLYNGYVDDKIGLIRKYDKALLILK